MTLEVSSSQLETIQFFRPPNHEVGHGHGGARHLYGAQTQVGVPGMAFGPPRSGEQKRSASELRDAFPFLAEYNRHGGVDKSLMKVRIKLVQELNGEIRWEARYQDHVWILVQLQVGNEFGKLPIRRSSQNHTPRSALANMTDRGL